MIFLLLVIVFFISLILYLLYTSFEFQFYLHRKKIKSEFLDKFINTVKGTYIEQGYFALSHRVVTNKEYNSYSNRQKTYFTKCYNIVTFKTEDANWEFFFYLVKNGMTYSEIMSIRVFPKNKIRSEGNVERMYSKINIYANNSYLAKILDQPQMEDYFHNLVRKNGDILLLMHNNMHHKAFLKSNNLKIKRTLDMIKYLHLIKNKIYRDNILEY